MNGLQPAAIGILPAGALGVSLFYHLTWRLEGIDESVCFLERPGSKSFLQLRSTGRIRVNTEGEIKDVPLAKCLRGDPLASWREGTLPEALLICTNPDQLLEVVNLCVELLVTISREGYLTADAIPFPAVVLCSNGIYHQRVRQLFVEKLEEATLYGRLPDLWPRLMPAIVGRWLRGVSIQTGVRDGAGAETIYLPGPSGRTRIAGGDAAVRGRVVALCAGRGAWFEDAGGLPPTRIEFDKAIVNLASNLIGLLTAIDDDGRFRPLRVEEIATPANRARIEELAGFVYRVGRAVRAYQPTDELSALIAELQDTMRIHAAHVPSSIQWVGMQLRRGQLRARLTPTEQWLIEPLAQYARAAHLDTAAHYFRSLELALIDKLNRACERAKK